MIEISLTNIITVLSLAGAAIAGWALREFSSINRKHDDLDGDVKTYIHHTDETITDIKVNVGKIQVSIENIEEMIKQ